MFSAVINFIIKIFDKILVAAAITSLEVLLEGALEISSELSPLTLLPL